MPVRAQHASIALLATFLAAPAAGVSPDRPGDKLSALLQDVAAGRKAPDGLRLKARDRGAGVDVEVYGSGVGFVGDVQVKLPPKDVREAVGRLVKAGFADMPPTFGGLGGRGGPAVGGPAPGAPMAPALLVRSVEFRMGDVSKTVTQLAGGEQSKPLADLVAGLHEPLKPLAAKGLDPGKLSLEQALAGLAKGDVAPEAVSLALTLSPRKPGGAKGFFRFTDAVVTAAGQKGYVDLPLTREQTEAIAKRIGTLLAGKGLDRMPRQLWWPDALVGLSLSVRGNKENLSISADTGPYNQKLKAAHPQAQKDFDAVVRGLLAIEQELRQAGPAPRPPHGKPHGQAPASAPAAGERADQRNRD